MKKYSKLLCAILTVCMMLTILPFGAFAATPASFKDVKGHWAEDYIVYMSNTISKDGKQYIIGGYADGTFKPDTYITRGAVAAILDRADGFTRTNKTKDFPDVAKDNVFYANIMACADNGVINGYKDGTFKPANNITRQAAIAMIARCAMTEANYKEFANAAECQKFLAATYTDWTQISQDFYAEICFLAKYGNLQGYKDGTMRPQNNITRAEFVKLLFGLVRGDGTPVVPGKTYTLGITVSDGKNTETASAKLLTSKSNFVAEVMQQLIAKRGDLEKKFDGNGLGVSVDKVIAVYNKDKEGGWTSAEKTEWMKVLKAEFGEASGDGMLINAALNTDSTLADLNCTTYTANFKDSAGTQYTVSIVICQTAA